MNALAICAPNFRGIESIEVNDGRRLKPGSLFRSGDMSELTERCVATIDNLGIRSFVDLRSAAERERFPYLWLPAIDPAAWGDAQTHAAASLSELVRQPSGSTADVIKAMCALYRELPFVHAQSYTTLFTRIAGGRLPILFGCSAGKDRTGVAAALILSSVGASDEDILTDYMLTNLGFAQLQERATRQHGFRRSPKLDAVLRAEPEFLDAAMDEIKTRHGGIAGYLKGVLGLSDDDLKRLKDMLLY